MNNVKPFLSVNNLKCSRSYECLFDNLRFDLYPGESLVIKGENGSGKTTLILALLNLIPYSGKVVWSHKINVYGYVSHKYGIKSYETIREYMHFWSKFYKYRSSYKTILSSLNLLAYLDTPTAFLSQGQKKKLSLARVFLVNTKVWFLDEPTASLDKKSKSLIEKKINMHNSRGGISIISSHDNIKIKQAKILELGIV